MRRAVATVFCAAALGTTVLAGCSDGGAGSSDESRSTTTSSAQAPISTTEAVSATTPSATSATDLRDDCAGLTDDDLGSIFSIDFELPTESSGGVSTIDDFNYKTVGCSFESSDGEVEVDLNLSFAEQFDDGMVHCVEPSDHLYPVIPVDDLGESAWWQTQDFENSTDAEGQLTICVDEALIAIEIEGPTTLQVPMQQQATDIARLVVT
ncbi:hypothetical protein [Williamsia soli]|uniref:hypothetical protein n=1 Tax=Williamsia soli TaxID=364929 RepID=UPI001A9FD86F|nr:hypothetical protein [Williamsia soli]